jgi:hypothetical protein
MKRHRSVWLRAAGKRIAPLVTGAIAAILALPCSDAAHPADPGTSPTSLTRLVRHFDFEEAERAPYEMPLHFYRRGGDYGLTDGAFPPFGEMRLTNSRAYSGRWSFMFSLDGGSMAARVPSAVIPVMPNTDYHVAVRVRTEGLTHARARLVAWLYDQNGRIIPASRRESELINTRGEWRALSVAIRGRYDLATDLGLELQLVQPDQFSREGEPGRVGRSPAAPARDRFDPVLADFAGRAFFDDVSVWQQPRIEIRTTEPGNVIAHPEKPRLIVEVHDVVHQDLRAHLQLFDVDGRVIHEERFPAPHAPRPRTIDLPIMSFGWYRASLDILLDGEIAARRWIDLAYVPQPHRAGTGDQHRFILSLPPAWQRHEATLPTLVRRLETGRVILPVLDESVHTDTAADAHRHSQRTIEHLRSEHVELVFGVPSVPHDLAREHDLRPNEVLLAIDREPRIWHEYLNEWIVNYGFEVPRWQFGSVGSDEVFWLHNAPDRVQRATASLRSLVPGATAHFPSMAHHEPVRLPAEANHFVILPAHIRPCDIEHYVELWLRAQHGHSADATSGTGRRPIEADTAELVFAIEASPLGLYMPRERATDVMLRVLHAWRAGATHVSFDPPWASDPFNGNGPMPDETFAVWKQLITQLRGRRVIGTLPIGRGMTCWVLAGEHGGDGALVAWAEPGHPHAGVKASREAVAPGFNLQLADQPVTVTDAFGNRWTVPLRYEQPADARQGGEADPHDHDLVHSIELDEMPRFVEGINLELVRFRSSFAIEPSFLPVESRVHEHEIVLGNPWDMPINGIIRVRETEGLDIMPRVHRFMIPANGQVRLPVAIQLSRSILGGHRRIAADVSLTADGQYDLTLFEDVRIGLEHLDFSATARLSRNAETGERDLIVTQYITNTGKRSVNVEAFMLGRGVRHERQLIAGLTPGEMAIRVFTVPGGGETLGGETLRVGVIDPDGQARLNQLITVPVQ